MSYAPQGGTKFRYRGCRWCGGAGCLMCPKEEDDARHAAARPVFVARADNARDMELLREAVHRDVIEQEIQENGFEQGMRNVALRLVLASLSQIVGDPSAAKLYDSPAKESAEEQPTEESE